MELQGTPQAGRMLSWALPVLLHRLANQTQWITGLRSMLSLGGGDDWLRSRGADLMRTGQTMQDIGWLLAVFGSAQGSNLLLARREPRGLDLMFDLVAEGVRRETGRSMPPPKALPELTSEALDGWQLPFAFGSLLWQAYGLSDSTQGFWFERELGTDWILDVPWNGADPSEWAELCGATLLGYEGQRLRLCLPAAWLGESVA